MGIPLQKKSMSMEGNKNIKIAAIAITYYPKVEEVMRNILQYIQSVDHLIIWENTPINEREQYRIEIPEYRYKISYRSINKNAGIAYPLNQMAIWAKQNDYTHILSMDQDSWWVNFEEFVQSVSNYPDNRHSILAPNVNREWNDSADEALIVDDIIISGTVWPLHVIDRVGWFDEKLFVDTVDIDFSIRANKQGIKTVVFTHSYLIQQYGYPAKSKLFKWTSSNYSVERTYNIVKNHLILWRRYKKDFPKAQKKLIVKKYILYRLIKIVLIEKEKIKKVFAVMRGVFDGLSKPMQ